MSKVDYAWVLGTSRRVISLKILHVDYLLFCSIYMYNYRYFSIQKPWPGPSQAGAKPSAAALAWPEV